jgi:hypothetical protein
MIHLSLAEIVRLQGVPINCGAGDNLITAATLQSILTMGLMMSDDGTMATGARNETRDAGPKLYGASDEPLYSVRYHHLIRSSRCFVKQRPFTSSFAAAR